MSSPAPQPPSFLVLMADQLGAPWLPAYGCRVGHTPHLDALAAQSTVFDRAYCPVPLCAPSRAALVTGRPASEVGVYDNAAELPATVPTLAHALRAAGWFTAVAGKMHFVGPDQLHGFEQRLTADIYPADIDWTPDWERPLDEPEPWYHTMESVLDPGVCPAAMQTDYDDEVAFAASRALYDIARQRRDQPFLLWASFTNPHDPWELPARCWDAVAADAIPDPAVDLPPLPDADPHSRRLRTMCGIDAAQITPEQIRHARRAYFAAVAYLDERVGQVLDALRESGLSEHTTVVFCADHGEMLGEHGLWYKMAFFEPSVRVPLMIRAPGTPARKVAAPVSLMDVAPTLRALAGLPGPVDSGDVAVSLGDVVLDGAPPPARPVISEYHAEGVTAASAMIVDGRFKLIRSLADPDLLFDLEADPGELVNLAGAPEHAATVARLSAALAARLDLEAIDARVRTSQRERRLVGAAHARGERPQWDFEPRSDAARRYPRRHDDLYDVQRGARLDQPDERVAGDEERPAPRPPASR